MGQTDDELKREVAQALRQVREEARARAHSPPELPRLAPAEQAAPLPPLADAPAGEAPSSPDRRLLNERWDVLTRPPDRAPGLRARLLAPPRRLLRRLIRFALGPVIERQVELNSAQVRFDNELVEYLDARLDRLSAHYDRVLGLHGRRMAEIDERHLILQQELVRHVHELVQRIELVFETAEQNHLYLDAALRELREEARSLAHRVEKLS